MTKINKLVLNRIEVTSHNPLSDAEFASEDEEIDVNLSYTTGGKTNKTNKQNKQTKQTKQNKQTPILHQIYKLSACIWLELFDDHKNIEEPPGEDFIKDPPTFPPHFTEIILNSDIKQIDPYMLAMPHHVTVNHTYV